MDRSIRPAELADGPKIARLNEVVQSLHYQQRPDWFKAPNAALFLPIVRDWLRSPDVRVFVAETEGQLIGYSVGSKQNRRDTSLKYGMLFVELDQVVVEPDARKRGIGRALCGAVIDWATGEGASRIELGTWAFNDAAYEVFEGLGFRPTVRRMSLIPPKPTAWPRTTA